ncbi:TPA: adenylosuccinate synthase [Acinetobacter baumannii]|uniref:adenylosuccinate synthase n=1 Tax=Acinetobacter baumannii TaxID=470 RepID=UPI00225592E9|nr:adenylosuccinate synthase [Acinetobacter baumannii]MCX3034205.1 adenylosuccinate synthase [Acinetobacter baumannii]
MSLNHKQLCEVGAKFLKRPESSNGHGCHFALIEPSHYGENPDVYGVRHGCSGFDVGTVLLEAKTSRSDFLADKKKPQRIDQTTGIGKWRYYICPTGLIKPEELPEKWGLIYVSDKGVVKIIAGALAVEKKTYYSDWKQEKPKRCRDGNELRESFAKYAFEERNTEREFNLLAMALARLTDPEKTLYLQRDLMRLQNKVNALNTENRLLSKELSTYKIKEINQSLDNEFNFLNPSESSHAES